MTPSAEALADVELLPGYRVDPATGAWLTLPWPGDSTLPWNHPDRLALLPASLGPGAIRWAETWLVHHLTGKPWRYTAGQKRFLVWWYAVDVETGRWLYRSGVRRGAKGTGKDPFAAAWSLTELAGPVMLHDVDDGRAIGAEHRMALVQIGANSQAQASDVLKVANAMISDAMADEYDVDAGVTRTQLGGGGRIELLTSSEMSTEGDPATAVALNESHHMTEQNGGHRLADVARRNVGKSPKYLQARLIEFTNAHRQGSDSVAERSYQAWQLQVQGKAARADILYDSTEASPATRLEDEASLRAGLAAAYSDADWADLERLHDEALDPRTSPGDSIRFYLNGLAAAEDAWVDPKAFDALSRSQEVVADRELVTMFLDCSKSTDATGLVACRLSDGHVFTLGMWAKPHGARGKEWLVPRAEVDATVRAAMARYDLRWFGVDPSPARDDENEALYWAELIDGWHRDFRRKLKLWATPGRDGSAVLFDMRLSTPGSHQRNRLFTEQAMLTVKEIEEPSPDGLPLLTHDGHAGLRIHAHNAKERPNQWGITLGKVSRDSSKLVDLAVCMVGARLGRRLVLNAGKGRRGGRMG